MHTAISRRLASYCPQLLTVLSAAALLGCLAGTVASAADRPGQKPSILFCSPSGTQGWNVNMTYVKELHQKGFEVDYTETLDEFFGLSPERIQKYNVLVIYITPDAYKVCNQNLRSSPELVARFRSMVDDYVSAGGGVLLMPDEGNLGKQHVGDLTAIWGIKIASERIEEKNPEFVGKLSNASYDVPLFYTDNILPSPVSDGVTGVWYPTMQHYNGTATNPLVAEAPWQVVIKGSKTSTSRGFGKSKDDYSYGEAIAGVPSRAEPVTAPDLFAVRDYKKGRIALAPTMPQFSIGSGTQFIFDREVLSKGIKERKSDFGRLLENCYRWLAAPSLANGAVGGYSTRESALIPINFRPYVREFNEYTFWFWEYNIQQWHVPPKNGLIFKGLIGAHSAYSDGTGTVAEYKAAAQRAGLDFVVFNEDFAKLTKEKYDQLVAECKALSDSQVKLIPGMTLRNNIGNYTLSISTDGFWPGPENFTTADKKVLTIQPEEAPGVYSGYNTGSAFNWLLAHCHQQRNIGYYNWADSGKGMRMPFQRLAALAAIRYYKGGKLVEDMTDDYLTTLQSTMPPSPIAVNDVFSPAELEKEARSGHALTYGTARSIHTIMEDILRWSTTYDGMNVFLSDGPIIRAWPTCYRPMSYGSEEFVTVPAVMESPLHVTSEVGLKEIKVYNGRDLFRRFAFQGEKEFNEKLILDGTILRNMVVIAEDVKGGKAVSFARRSSKYDVRAVSYCADHVNDGPMRSFHGPGGLPVCSAPELPIDVSGTTWDGGPPAAIPLVFMTEARPALEADKGNESGSRFNQYPISETEDEGMLAMASRQEEVMPDSLKRNTNAWHVFGPQGTPSKLIEYTLRYKEYYPPTSGAPESDAPIRGMRTGIRPCVYRQEITLKDDLTVKRLLLLQNGSYKPKAMPAFMVIGRKPDLVEKVINGETMEKSETIRFDTGDWFAAFSPKVSSAHLFVVVGEPVVMTLNNYSRGQWFSIGADLAGKTVRKGETHTYEFLSLNSSVDVEVRDVEKVKWLRAYLNRPENMTLLRGSQSTVPGFVDLDPKDYAVEVAIPKPTAGGSLSMALPVRIPHLNPHWSAGLFQKAGYVRGYYGTGENRYRGLGVDFAGSAHFPLYVDKAEKTQVLAGHPVVADERGKELAINVVCLYSQPWQWHVSVNNPTDKEVTATLKQAMDLPSLDFQTRDITLAPGEYRVLTAKK